MSRSKGISLLCCYNDPVEAQEMLLSSIQAISDTLPFALDVHMIDTKAKGYRSAAEAYNREVELNEKTLNGILIFCHQDISFPDGELLCRIYAELSENPRQILGVAGMPKVGTPVSNLRYKSDDRYITRCQIDEKTPVVTLDECLIAADKQVFCDIKFDQSRLRHWHLYAVDLCYDAALNHGINSFVLPEIIYHKSSQDRGQETDDTFLREINRIACKYNGRVSVVRTPCYILSTSFIPRYMQLARTWLKHYLHRKN